MCVYYNIIPYQLYQCILSQYNKKTITSEKKIVTTTNYKGTNKQNSYQMSGKKKNNI